MEKRKEPGIAADNGYRYAAPLSDGSLDGVPIDPIGRVAGGCQNKVPGTGGIFVCELSVFLDLRRLAQRGMGFHVELTLVPADLDRLVHDVDFGSFLYLIEQPLDIFGIETNASEADATSYAVWLVGAVDQIAWPPKV